MATPARAADGRRLYTPEFKRQQVDRVLRGEISLAELGRELGISRSLIQRWKQLLTRGGETAVAANGEVVPASELRAAEQRIRAGCAEPVVQWLSDNEGMFTALETVITAERLGLAPVTTPAYSAQSNGMAEAFVKTLPKWGALHGRVWRTGAAVRRVHEIKFRAGRGRS